MLTCGPESQRRPLLGLSGRRGRELRGGHLVHLRPPSPPSGGAVHFDVAGRTPRPTCWVRGRSGSRLLPTSCGPTASSSRRGRPGLEVRVTGVWCGTPATLSSLLGPFRTQVGVAADRTTSSGPRRTSGPCSSRPVARARPWPSAISPRKNRAGTLSRSAFAAKSGFVTTPLPDAGVAAVVNSLESLGQELPGVGGGLVFDSYGGAINDGRRRRHRLRPSRRHRFGPVQRQLVLGFRRGRCPGGRRRGSRPPRARWLPMSTVRTRTTSTRPCPTGRRPTTDRICPGSAQVKRAYDPDDFFHFAQSVPLSPQRGDWPADRDGNAGPSRVQRVARNVLPCPPMACVHLPFWLDGNRDGSLTKRETWCARGPLGPGHRSRA